MLDYQKMNEVLKISNQSIMYGVCIIVKWQEQISAQEGQIFHPN